MCLCWLLVFFLSFLLILEQTSLTWSFISEWFWFLTLGWNLCPPEFSGNPLCTSFFFRENRQVQTFFGVNREQTFHKIHFLIHIMSDGIEAIETIQGVGGWTFSQYFGVKGPFSVLSKKCLYLLFTPFFFLFSLQKNIKSLFTTSKNSKSFRIENASQISLFQFLEEWKKWKWSNRKRHTHKEKGKRLMEIADFVLLNYIYTFVMLIFWPWGPFLFIGGMSSILRIFFSLRIFCPNWLASIWPVLMQLSSHHFL